MRRTILSAIVMLAFAGAGAGAYYHYVAIRPAPRVSTMAIGSGDVLQLVKATGTLSPLRSVDIGSQVSGIVTKLHVDFNSIVKKGQLLAELDPSQYKDALDSARAMVEQATIALEEQQEVLLVDQKNLDRTRALFAKDVAAQQDLDNAVVTVKQDDALVAEDKATIVSAQDAVKQAEVNLSYCTIYSPIDGVVISRNVDEGQAVQSRVATPSLYLLGTDLENLQLIGDIDESDLGRLRPGQPVTFMVDAYPTTRFTGSVAEVRLNSTTINSVVTYQVVITARNPDLRLLPGMTATVNIETSRADHVTRLPNNALRFKPTPDMFTAFGQPVPVGIKAPAATTSAVVAPAPASASATRPQPPMKDSAAKQAMLKAAGQPGVTIDQFFEPVPVMRRPAQVWIMSDHKLVSLSVELGITDGTWTQVVSGNVEPGQEIVSSIFVPPTTTKAH